MTTIAAAAASRPENPRVAAGARLVHPVHFFPRRVYQVANGNGVHHHEPGLHGEADEGDGGRGAGGSCF